METLNLPKIISIDDEKCVNCHQCIAVCSTKFANNGFGDVVEINDDLCIGCGECIKACTHDARIPLDDFESAMTAISNKDKIVAVVAPAIAAQFPEKYLHFNGWLKSLGISAFFDVSFGAELTIKSYLNHLSKNNPKTVIAQPCPAIVSYIEVYKPELIPHLAPADSPMVHTIKMIRKYYPQYKNHKLLVVSPCLAKKREFDAVKQADFNVTMRSFEKYFELKKIDIEEFPIIDFDNDPAERAVLFSSPGGLLSTAERYAKQIRESTRKIEGPHTIYNYLDHLPEQLEMDRAPLLIDCLNCENGCNGGTGTTKQESSADELEFYIQQRKKDMQVRYDTQNDNEDKINKLNEVVEKYWDDTTYTRKYKNRNKLFTSKIKNPSEEHLEDIYKRMHKTSEKDILNCSSCGYNTCEMMATAIFNDLNKVENCHHFINTENERKSYELEQAHEKLIKNKNELIAQSEDLLSFIEKIRKIAK